MGVLSRMGRMAMKVEREALVQVGRGLTARRSVVKLRCRMKWRRCGEGRGEKEWD